MPYTLVLLTHLNSIVRLVALCTSSLIVAMRESVNF
jgi:hypothetical protein